MAGRLFNSNIEHPRDAEAAALKASAAMYRAARRAVAPFRLNPTERDELLTLLGLKGATERLVASNSRLRIHSTKTLVDMFYNLVKAGAKVVDRRYWHVSFLGPLINEYRPELDVDAYRAVIYRLLEPYPLNAVFSIELQTLTNYPQGGCGRSFLLNAHALAWTDDPTFDPVKAENEMSARPVLRNEFDAKNVTFKPRENTKEVPYLGHYLTSYRFWGSGLRGCQATPAGAIFCLWARSGTICSFVCLSCYRNSKSQTWSGGLKKEGKFGPPGRPKSAKGMHRGAELQARRSMLTLMLVSYGSGSEPALAMAAAITDRLFFMDRVHARYIPKPCLGSEENAFGQTATMFASTSRRSPRWVLMV